MLTPDEFETARLRALDYLARAGIRLRPDEAAHIEVADFGLGELAHSGLELITYVNTERVCAQELVLFPGQTCPEHRHPPTPLTGPGKEETFRCRWGTVYLYLPGQATARPLGRPPEHRRAHYMVGHEIVLQPGEQHTIPPDTLHWFQAGQEGAIITEFSTHSDDASDVFTDPEIER